MDLAVINKILDAESSVFKNAIQIAVDEAMARRSELKAQVAETLELNKTGEMSEEDFFIALDAYSKIADNFRALLVHAGFDESVGSAWLAKTGAPRPRFRRATAQMLLEVVMDYYADSGVLHDMHVMIEEWGRATGVNPAPTMSRAEMLSKDLETFHGYSNLSVRTRNALRSNDIRTLGELVAKTDQELLRTPNFGRKSYSETQQFLNGLQLTLGCLSEAEDEEVRNRRLLNEIAEKLLITEWLGDVLPEYKHAEYQAKQEAGWKIYEKVTADQDLINALAQAGIRYRTQLATAPKKLLDEICTGHEGWSEQLPHILNGREYPSCGYVYELKLGTPVPRYLNQEVKVYGTE